MKVRRTQWRIRLGLSRSMQQLNKEVKDHEP